MASWFQNGVRAVSDDKEDEEADEQVKDLKAQIVALKAELEVWRKMHADEVEFTRHIILKLIDKPAAPLSASSLLNRPTSSLSPKDLSRIDKGKDDTRDKHVDLKAGPAAKLPL